jgi:uncharacterized protein HemX
MSQGPEPETPVPDSQDEPGGIGPYLLVVLVAVVLALALGVYVAGYRDEIIAILTQSPT